MSNVEAKEIPETRSSLQILQDSVEQTSSLEEQAQRALRANNTAFYRLGLLQRAELVSILPVTLSRATDAVNFSLEGNYFGRLEQMAMLASLAILAGTDFRLAAFLDIPGSNVGDPNMLEMLVKELEEAEQAAS